MIGLVLSIIILLILIWVIILKWNLVLLGRSIINLLILIWAFILRCHLVLLGSSIISRLLLLLLRVIVLSMVLLGTRIRYIRLISLFLRYSSILIHSLYLHMLLRTSGWLLFKSLKSSMNKWLVKFTIHTTIRLLSLCWIMILYVIIYFFLVETLMKPIIFIIFPKKIVHVYFIYFFIILYFFRIFSFSILGISIRKS